MAKRQGNKDETVLVRLTGQEKRLLVQTADKRSLSLSSWLRMVALREAKDPRDK